MNPRSTPASLTVAFALLLSLPATSLSADLPGQVKCPVIATRRGGEYQSLSNREFVCFSSTRSVRALGYLKSRLFVPGGFRTQQFFTLHGIGENVSPVFRVTRNSAVVSYSYTGSGSFEIELLDQRTGGRVATIARARGPVNSETYVNFSGLYYLRISGDNDRAPNELIEPSWSVSLSAE